LTIENRWNNLKTEVAESGAGHTEHMRYLDSGTAKKISKIGLGTWQFAASEWGYGEEYAGRAAYAIVRRAVELGVTLFDTAEIYSAGHSERILGRALGDYRDSVCIADKIFPLGPDVPLVKRRAMASAGRLGVSRLDLYQVHYPNPLVRDHTLMRGMRSLQRAGLVDEVGVSGYSVARWRAAENALGSRILSNQVSYSLVDRSAEEDLLPFAESHARIIIAHSPLAQGLLSGRYHGTSRPGDRVRATSSHFRPESIERTRPLITVLREVAEAHHATPAQIALAWVIQHPAVAAIPGASSVEQLERNAAAAEILLADDEYRALQAASRWSRAPAMRQSSPRRRLSELKHCARAGWYLAKTVWHDSR
jgi:aryl-alcohol dehydrogenase-like predicted oxidoreductase